MFLCKTTSGSRQEEWGCQETRDFGHTGTNAVPRVGYTQEGETPLPLQKWAPQRRFQCLCNLSFAAMTTNKESSLTSFVSELPEVQGLPAGLFLTGKSQPGAGCGSKAQAAKDLHWGDGGGWQRPVALFSQP